MNTEPNGNLTRRQAITAGIAATAAVAGAHAAHSVLGGDGAAAEPAAAAGSAGHASLAKTQRQPVVFLPHGGGPWPFVELGIGRPDELAELSAYLRGLQTVPHAPKAVLIVSAHWEEPVPTVMSGAQPPMLYDYYGFPPEAYTVTWSAPGEPQLAARVQALLAQAGLPSASNAERGFDHGTFVPLKLVYPEANLPTVQLSLKRGLDPAEHLAIGRALQPLRDEGVFIVGSGMTYHNLRAFGPAASPIAEQFDAWLRAAATAQPAQRDQLLSAWLQAPQARKAHPREEHLLPLMVIAGAAGSDVGRVAYNGTILDLRLSAYHFG